VSAASDKIAFASGSGGVVLRTRDGGATWQKLSMPADAAKLDFRDVDAIDARTVYALSIGAGDSSRIYKTTDGGDTWNIQFSNDDPKGFYDAMSFWDADHGVVFGDSIGDRLQILMTSDAGLHWNKVPEDILPKALDNEGAFAGSGTNIAVFGKSDAWIGTGAGPKCRIIHTGDRGQTWSVADTPIAASSSGGIFSVAFRDRLHGVTVGGDYRNEKEAVDNLATTSDGGQTWTLVKAKGLSGFRSVVKFVPGTKSTFVAVGPQGADISEDDGRTWTPVEMTAPLIGFDTLSFAPGKKIAFGSGNRGAIGKLEIR
jgi:photosystem II stability/assembly factor-like uncharacterized protein